jgi:hypothetical protein
MTRIRPLLAAIGLAFLATAALAPAAAADNCDIFINPEDCQNTGWTVGTIAVLTGGVAVATAAVMTGQHNQPPPPPVPPPLPLPGTLRPGTPRRPRPDDEETIEGVAVRPVMDAPTVTVQSENTQGRAHSVRLRIGLDRGIQEVDDGRG